MGTVVTCEAVSDLCDLGDRGDLGLDPCSKEWPVPLIKISGTNGPNVYQCYHSIPTPSRGGCSILYQSTVVKTVGYSGYNGNLRFPM